MFEEGCEPLRTFGENLEGMVRAPLNDIKNLLDIRIRYAPMEQVRHGIDEIHRRLLSPQGFF